MGDQAQKLKREEKKSKERRGPCHIYIYIYNKSTVNGKQSSSATAAPCGGRKSV